VHTLSYVLLALKVALIGGWVHLVFLLARSLRPSGRGTTVYTFRLLAMLLGVGAAAQAMVLLVHQASNDRLLPAAIGRWGGWIWVETPIILLLVVTTLMLVRLMTGQRYRAIDEALREIRRLRTEVGTDPLTGLWNRASLNQQLQETLATGEPLTLIFIDVDDFKAYNDSHGHLAGDEVLRQLGSILLHSVRRSDVVGRYGGEEFVILLRGARGEVGRRIAEHVRRRVEEHEFEHRRITLSVGVAAAPTDSTDGRTLLQLADQAMYRAKADGGNRVYACCGNAGAARCSQEGETLP